MKKEIKEEAERIVNKVQKHFDCIKQLVAEIEVDEPEDKYPGAWKRYKASEKAIITDGMCQHLHSEKIAIEAVTGSRLLQWYLTMEKSNWPFMTDIKNILDDHKAMMKEVVE